ncbi:DEAD/DEAH box helicase [Cutibacterium sp.]|uniref:DEAD/DEAH box helicase n=1 Tax=Cutibacterium sp. TaxID=1912221 RepID=UPI0026DB77A5|nr:DEAD/DEAH box helicase [Cutibacterium sp.]MDO4413161.1 DEAD/DEAH box helicase [Cutibacterium sp.]
MDWKATELTDLDVSGVDHEGGFSALGVPDEIVAALAATGITKPFRIQIAAIPDAIAGRDVLGRASTGSGKTLAFGVPLLSRLSAERREDKRPGALILSPTRELAMQIADVLSPLASSMGLSTILIAGGMSYGPQTRAFKKGVDLVVATPGRLVDLLETGDADLSGITVTVLDEADHMAELGFMEAVGSILDAVPAEGQRLLFSATLDSAVNKLVKRYMHDPVIHEIDSDKGSVATMTHYAFQIKPHEKVGLMCEIANRDGHTIVFARTQRGASRMAEQIREAGVMAGALHGGLTQGARARVLAAFKDGSLPVLVATDVAARGIDVDDVTLVLQVDPPMNSKDYLHRSGRTARAGHDGAVVSLVLPHQRRSMSRLYRQAGVKPVQAQVMIGDEYVAEVAGCRPAEGAPIDEKTYEALVAPKQQRSKKSRDGKPRRGKGGRNRGGRGYDRDRRSSYNHEFRGHNGRSHEGRRGHDGHRRDFEAKYGRSGNDTW